MCDIKCETIVRKFYFFVVPKLKFTQFPEKLCLKQKSNVKLTNQ